VTERPAHLCPTADMLLYINVIFCWWTTCKAGSNWRWCNRLCVIWYDCDHAGEC